MLIQSYISYGDIFNCSRMPNNQLELPREERRVTNDLTTALNLKVTEAYDRM